MDSQGADFTFDMNMDFSNVFAMKPAEENTSTGFFGDEGIDATTGFSQDFSLLNPMLNTTPQEQTYMPQLTMDNTSGGASMWTGQLTPQSQNALSSFPPTPLQSFDNMFEQPATLGKRALQLDVEDFPQAKRHETIDYTTMFSPSNWTLEAQPTPPSVTCGLSDEAADMCAMWFNKYAILPSDRHINSLSQLTGESADAIRHWFGRMLKQGMGSSQGDSAYKSQTAFVQQDQFWNDFSTDIMAMPTLGSEDSTQEESTSPEVVSSNETTTVVKPANALRSGKKQRCAPTEDRSLLSRDPEKIYQCTRKCGKRYGRKCDWKRNEEEGYPCKSWVCSLCVSDGAVNVKPCFRKYHFAQHFRNIHPGLNCEDYEETSIIASETDFPRQCGFCKHRFESRQERIDHIAEHFKQGKCMLDWNENGGDDSSGSDDGDDDNDRPSRDSFSGSKPPHEPPQYDPRGGSGSKHSSGGSSGGNSGAGGSQGGFFQFQLSQQQTRESGSKLSLKPSEVLQRNERGLRASSEPIRQCSAGLVREIDESEFELHGEPGTAAEHDKNALARDAVAEPLKAMDVVHGQYYGNGADLLLIRNASAEDAVRNSREVLTEIEQSQSSEERASQTSPSLLPKSPTPSTNLKQVQQELLRFKDAVDAAVASSPEVLQTIPTTSQSFLSLKLLGSGGFSTVDEVVHRGTNLRLGRKTLKNRNPAAIKELLKEVNVLQKLRHPHVIRFLGAYTRGDKMSILVSPVADTTLSLWLDRFLTQQTQPANLAQIITKMFGCLASSVRYLHEQRPVVKHMDIKPQNILVVEGDAEFPHVVLCDFGISSAEELTQDQTAQPLTRHYVAPEVFDGFTRCQAADIWSLGCVFAEMASVPFSQSNSTWLKLRKEFNGKTGKHYWQDIDGLQNRLSLLLEETSCTTETNVIVTLKSMLQAHPANRPEAASLTLVFTPAPCCLSWPNDKAAYPGPREELSSVERLQSESNVQSLNANSDDPAGLSNAKEWLQKCSHTHDACSPSTAVDARTLPTRLIDIQPSDEQATCVRLVDGAKIIDPSTEATQYIALSHVWGNSDVNLTSDNLQAMEANLPRELLSESLNAAITTAQGLGYRYIWVDSLCVLQDSDQDKQQECAKMASVYRNAAVTIILDQIDNALDVGQNPLTGRHGDRLTPSTALPALNFTTPGFGWDTRAWALQERLLSHRFLHLGREQLYWECNSLKASDTFPQGLSSLVWEKVHRKLDNVKDVEYPNMKKMTNAVKHTTSLAEHRTGVTDNAKRLGPERLIRDCQWIKKQGDHTGNSTSAEPMNSHVAAVAATNDKLTCNECPAHTKCTGNTPLRFNTPPTKALAATAAPLSSSQEQDSGPSTTPCATARAGPRHDRRMDVVHNRYGIGASADANANACGSSVVASRSGIGKAVSAPGSRHGSGAIANGSGSRIGKSSISRRMRRDGGNRNGNGHGRADEMMG